MRYYKIINNGYIEGVGIGCGGNEISKEEYINLLSMIKYPPEADEGCYFKLKEDLTREQHVIPVITDENDEISGDELMTIIKEVL